MDAESLVIRPWPWPCTACLTMSFRDVRDLSDLKVLMTTPTNQVLFGFCVGKGVTRATLFYMHQISLPCGFFCQIQSRTFHCRISFVLLGFHQFVWLPFFLTWGRYEQPRYGVKGSYFFFRMFTFQTSQRSCF